MAYDNFACSWGHGTGLGKIRAGTCRPERCHELVNYGVTPCIDTPYNTCRWWVGLGVPHRESGLCNPYNLLFISGTRASSAIGLRRRPGGYRAVVRPARPSASPRTYIQFLRHLYYLVRIHSVCATLSTTPSFPIYGARTCGKRTTIQELQSTYTRT